MRRILHPGRDRLSQDPEGGLSAHQRAVGGVQGPARRTVAAAEAHRHRGPIEATRLQHSRSAHDLA
ncbi:hypothetical protein DESC_370141 [Desulfosarcina cetonica]|nr:hypothetical protein DESC_370141 [Desulfosarcina cetonica]